MVGTSKERISEILAKQRDFFHSGATLDLEWRKEQLRSLRHSIDKWEETFYDALKKDLNKSRQEAFITEISIVKGEISNHLRHLGQWARRKKVPSPMTLFPFGTALV